MSVLLAKETVALFTQFVTTHAWRLFAAFGGQPDVSIAFGPPDKSLTEVVSPALHHLSAVYALEGLRDVLAAATTRYPVSNNMDELQEVLNRVVVATRLSSIAVLHVLRSQRVDNSWGDGVTLVHSVDTAVGTCQDAAAVIVVLDCKPLSDLEDSVSVGVGGGGRRGRNEVPKMPARLLHVKTPQSQLPYLMFNTKKQAMNMIENIMASV